MGVYLNPGNDMFQMAINSEIYVDKTALAIHLMNLPLFVQSACQDYRSRWNRNREGKRKGEDHRESSRKALCL